MFCPKCGNQIPDTAAFCSKCGNPVQQAAPQQPVYQQPQPTYQQPVYQQPAYQQPTPGYGAPNPAPKKSKKGLVIGIVAVVAVVAIVIGILLATGVIGGKDEETGAKASSTAVDGAKSFVEALLKLPKTKSVSSLAPYTCVDIISIAESSLKEEFGSVQDALDMINSYMDTNYKSVADYFNEAVIADFVEEMEEEADLSKVTITDCEEYTGSISRNRSNIDDFLESAGTSLDECVKNIEEETVVIVTLDFDGDSVEIPVYMIKTNGKWLAVGLPDAENWDF